MYIRHKAENVVGCYPCECDYQVGRCDKYYWVLIKQPVIKAAHEHIGMRTEQLATEIYFKELDGVEPSLVRFIEYYPPEEFPGGVFPQGFAEQRIELCFSNSSLLGKIFSKKPKFNGFMGTPSAHNPPFDDSVSFFKERGIAV
jgi:hypothetical protein